MGEALAKTIAFTGESGDRFIFPSWIIYPEDPDGPSLSDLWWRANAIVARVTGLKQEWIEFDPEHFPHVEGSIGSRIFQHGSASVMYFAGPEFDSVASLPTPAQP